MKKMYFVLAVTFLSMTASKANELYKLDDGKIDAMFANATEMTVNSVMLAGNYFSGPITTVSDDKNKILVAWIVDWFVGGFGIHRYVLGTKKGMWAIYTFTICGIFGVVPIVDWFVLLIDGLINEGGGKYIDNEKFFMWSK